jgi:hypothetical protein
MKHTLFYVAIHPVAEVLYSIGLKKTGASLYIAGAALCGIRLGE